MTSFIESWARAAHTSLGFFWMALWAFCLGYLISSLIQVLVTRERMTRSMGGGGPKAVLLGSFFGFLSSSCSFSALSATRALFQKGAGLAPAVAFLLASTNLVIELGIVIALFLGWQFVVGEYVGGAILILICWALIRLAPPRRLIEQARQRLGDAEPDDEASPNQWKKTLRTKRGWQAIGRTYLMEWQMVWKDVLIGFTVAGIIATFVPDAFFAALFPGSGASSGAELAPWEVMVQTLVGPLAAFCTFIGSMGNIPLAAVLFGQGVSFAGVMAFIFSDLVVLPVLRINASYYGWKMALYLLGLLFVALVVASLSLHYGLAAFGMLPGAASGGAVTEREFFGLDAGFGLNLAFLAASATLAVLARSAVDGGHDQEGHDQEAHGGHDQEGDDHGGHDHGGHDHGDGGGQRALLGLSVLALVWLVGGLGAGLMV